MLKSNPNYHLLDAGERYEKYRNTFEKMKERIENNEEITGEVAFALTQQLHRVFFCLSSANFLQDDEKKFYSEMIEFDKKMWFFYSNDPSTFEIDKSDEYFDEVANEILATKKLTELFTIGYPILKKIFQNIDLGGLKKNLIKELDKKEKELIEREKKLQAKEKIQTLRSIPPIEYLMTNDKVSNTIPQVEVSDKRKTSLAVNKGGLKGKKRVFTDLQLSFDFDKQLSEIPVISYNQVNFDNESVKIISRQKVTAYDRTVYNSICSLLNAGNQKFTPETVYRTMNGITNHEKISPQAVGTVTKSIDKMRFIRIKIDYTQEAKMRGLAIEKAEIDSYLLPAEATTLIASGVKKSGYILLKTPPLYEYANAINQVISVPIELLNTKDATRSTEDIIPIREYVIRQIEIMKNPKNKIGNKIVYDTIFRETNTVFSDGETGKTQRKRLKNAIKYILTLWVEQGYIKSFDEYKVGGSYKGVEITF